MTIENWISLTAIVATLLVPVIKVLLEYKLKNKKKTKGKPFIVRRPRSITDRILNFIFFAIPTANLFYAVLSSDPITRQSVFVISLSVASILFMLVMEYVGRILGILERIVTVHKNQDEINREVLGILGKINTTKRRRLTQTSTGRAKAARR